MGATKQELKSLAEDDVLAPRTAVPTIKSPWHPDDGLELVTELRANAVATEAGDENWMIIQLAKKRSRLRVGEIIDAIRKGTLRVGCRSDTSGYHGIVVRKDEIDSLAGAGPLLDPHLIPAAAFGRSIGLQDKGRFLALVSAGHTPAIRMTHPRSGVERYYLTEADIQTFHQSFVTLSTLVSETGDRRASVLARLKAKGVIPFSPGGEDFGNLYLRKVADHAARGRD